MRTSPQTVARAKISLPRIFRIDLAEFLQQIAHALVFRLRHHDLHFHNLVAALARLPNRRRALLAQAQFLAAVRARRNAHLRAAVDRRHFHFCAQRRFRHRDRNHRIEIVAAPLEEWMRLDLHHDVQIARRPAVQSRIAAPRNAHARAGLRAGRNAHVQRFHARHAAFAAAIPAHRTQTSRAAAARASNLKTHLAAHLRHLPRAAARGANFFIARLHARAVAHAAHVQPRDAQLLHRAAHRFGKRDLDLKFQVAARLALVGLARRVLAAKYLAEEIAEARSASAARAASTAKIESAEIEMNVFRRPAAAVTISSARRRSSALPRRVETELVVHLAFLGVRKNFVGFLNLLEFFFGGFVAGIQVRMIFAREFSVRRANFLHGSVARHAQQVRNNLVW